VPTDQVPVNVRSSAARLLAQIQGQASLETLLPLIEKGDIQFRVAALDAVSKIPGDNVTSALVARLASIRQADLRAEVLDALAKAKVAMIELLAARVATAHRDVVLKEAADADPSVRLAALRAMEKIGSDQDAARLVEIAVATTDGGEQSAALRAAAACAARGSDAEHRADPFVAALAGAKGGKRAAIERAMAKVGGAKA